MSLESDLFTRLTEQAGIADIVAKRVYPGGQPPQDTAGSIGSNPLLTQEILTGNEPGIMSGSCGAENMQVSIRGWTMDQAAMRRLMDAVRSALHRWKSGRVINCRFVDRSSEPNEAFPDVFVESHTYSVWYAIGASE